MPRTSFVLICALALLLFAGVGRAEETAKRKAKKNKPAATQKAKTPADESADDEKPVEKPAADADKPADAKPESAKPADAAAAKPADAAAAAKPAEQKPAAPSTHKVTRGPFKVDLALEGLFEAKTAAEILVRPKVWKEFEVRTAAEHGAEVRKGDVILEFNPERIDNALTDRRTDQRVAAMGLDQAAKALKILEEATPLDLRLAQRAKEMAVEDLDRFLKIDRPLNVKSAEYSLKMAQSSLENEEEELRQLEKMYKSDDLTEETEEIVLKRARESVDRSRFYLEMAKARHEESLQVSIPRYEETVKQTAEQAGLTHERAASALPYTLERAKIELERQKLQLTRSGEDLKKLEADHVLMSVKAPIDGVVYYGRAQRGQWSGASSAADDLRPGGTIMPGEVVMTVVQARPMFVRATLDEKQLHWIRPGLKAVVEPRGYGDQRLAGSIASVDPVPSAQGKFQAVVTVRFDDDSEALMPGMACTVKLTPYVRRNAILVPATAVFSEELADDKRFVYLKAEKGEPRKHPVTVGEKSGEKIEIVEGIEPGDEILLEKPGAKKP